MGIEVNGRKTQHYANGTPAINAKFPDMGALVDYGHSKQLRMGWYLNGCACGEHGELGVEDAATLAEGEDAERTLMSRSQSAFPAEMRYSARERAMQTNSQVVGSWSNAVALQRTEQALDLL